VFFFFFFFRRIIIVLSKPRRMTEPEERSTARADMDKKPNSDEDPRHQTAQMTFEVL